MFLKTIPVLPAVSIRDTIDFYSSKLGFTGVNQGDYGILKLKDAEIHLSMFDINKPFHPGSCFILTDDIECLYADFSAKELIYPRTVLKDKPGRYKEFSIKDNNGNLVRFGQKK
ncbi:hypothetical protein QWZ08_09235 [Ferruginibacter paludis]|uniref:hypothetical protein n=1 Tax=Ferruginibacter paludis TaxID=1310417 RepID=UPI0025B30730|nr:hypothetical protein [Ferruginibacter paludis]MDN3655806.1 hypothetical protein [Ferruginibacter paludis]